MPALFLAAVTLVALAQDPQAVVHLGAAAPRTGIARVVVPWPRGRHREVLALRIEDDIAPCVTLLRWPDGSVAVSHAHARVSVPGAREREIAVAVVAPVDPIPAEPSFRFDGPLPLRTTLEDGHGRRFAADLAPDPAGAIDGDLSSTRVRVRRFRGVHARTAENGVEVLLATQAWFVEFAGEARAELTLVLDNDPRDGELVAGPVRFTSFAVETTRADVELSVRHAAVQRIRAAVASPDGTTHQELIGPAELPYLGDRCGKTFRIDLVLTSAEPDAVREARAAPATPIVVFPDLEYVRATRAFGAFGGPAPRSTALEPDPRDRLIAWQDRNGRAGPFAPFGDVLDPLRDPSRTAPAALHDVLRWRSVALLDFAMLAVSQQTLRPTPGTVARESEGLEHLRVGLGPRATRRPHGWWPLEYESLGVDLLFDAYWLTGDPLARHELARIGTALPAILRAAPFRTSRGEGLALRAGALIARATNDAALLAALVDHARASIVPAIGAAPRGTCFPQPPHRRVFGEPESFDAGEQMALLALGLAALGDAADAADLRAAAVDVAVRIARDAWIDGSGPAAWISARDFRLRAAPRTTVERAGLCGALCSAFVIAHGIAESEDDRRLLARRVEELAQDPAVPPREAALSDPWFQLVFDRRPPIR